MIHIVGGGISGLSLGVALSARGLPVTVWEAGQLPRHRVCGEFICGVHPDTLENLGVAEDLSDALIHRLAVWKNSSGDSIFEGDLPRPAYGLSRYTLDMRMVERIRRNGGEVRVGERWRGDPDAEGVVIASGRRAERTSWMGFKLHVSGPLPRDLTLFLGQGGYVGLSPVEEGYWNLCGLFRKRSGVRAGKDEILQAYAKACGMTGVLDVLDAAEIRPGSAAGVAGVSFALQSDRVDELRLGDAWGVIPPFTGNGMSMAFESAELAIGPTQRWAEGREDWAATVQAVAEAHRRHLRWRFRVANLLHPILMRPAGLRLLAGLGRLRVLPFRPLFALTH